MLYDADVRDGSLLLVHFVGDGVSKKGKHLLLLCVRASPTKTHGTFAPTEAMQAEEVLLDPWRDILSNSSRERTRFRKSVLEYYCGDEKAVPCCMVSGLTGQGEKGITAAHIWPIVSRGRGLDRFGLTRQDVHDARNGLLLLRTVEKAFDAKRAGFFCGAKSEPVFVVLDPTLMNETVKDSLKFRDLMNKRLKLPDYAQSESHYPRRRLLAWHFSRVLREAHRLGWQEPKALGEYLEPSASDKVLSWLQEGSPQASWPGALAAGLTLLRVAGTASSSSASTRDASDEPFSDHS
jgi:hypothetical protein